VEVLSKLLSKFAIIIPVFEPSPVFWQLLSSLEQQTVQPSEIAIIIDGGESGEILRKKLIEKFFNSEHISVYLSHENKGLSNTYNYGVLKTSSPILVFIHQDVIPAKITSLQELLSPFLDPNVVAVGHVNQKWNYKQLEGAPIPLIAFLMATQYKKAQGWDGKFDAVRRSAFQEVGGFPIGLFRTAGEDGYLLSKLRKARGLVVNSNAEVMHFQTTLPFGWFDYFRKRRQYAEALGALFRNKSLPLNKVIFAFWRELYLITNLFILSFIKSFELIESFIIIGFLIIPWTIIPCLALIYSRRPMSLILTLALEPIAIIYSFWGLISGYTTGKQSF
jgi:GT2 family glycosyltransferase